MELKDIAQSIQTMESNLNKIQEKAQKDGEDGRKALELVEKAMSDLKEFKENGVTAEQLKQHGVDMQKQFDELAVQLSKGKGMIEEVKDAKTAITEALKKSNLFDFNDDAYGKSGNSAIFKALGNDKNASVRIPLDVKTMLLSTNLTGPSFASQDPRPAIFPSQKINARDLVNTFQTDSGYYVYWKEDAGETNNIAFQDEGTTKAENNYSFTGVQVVQGFLAGYSTFSKQMVNSLPFLTQTLPRMLMRDFYKKENASFATLIANQATGNTSITSTSDKVEKIIYYIANQLAANYNASFAVVNPIVHGQLVVSTYSKGYYPGAGTVSYDGVNLTLNGTPIIQASWATDGYVYIIDQDFVERVQVSGLAIELSYENNDNFVKNLVTARIECQEQFVLQLAPSALYGSLT